MIFAVVIERSENGYSAYIPDLPGCVAAGVSRNETEALIEEAARIHLEMMRENGERIPEPKTSTSVVSV